MHTHISESPTTFTEDDRHALAVTQHILANVPANHTRPWEIEPPRRPRFDPTELFGVVITKPCTGGFDVRKVVRQQRQHSQLNSSKHTSATTLVTGFAHIMGSQVGINADTLCSAKAA